MTEYTEARREYFRQRYQANKVQMLAKTREYQAAHPEVMKRAQAKYRQKNADALNASSRARHRVNKDRDQAQHRAWVARNKDERAQYLREWRQAKQAHRKAYDAAYRVAHPEQRAETQNRRRARQIGNGGSHTRAEWEALKLEYRHACGYCAAEGVRLTKDHDIPLARGGSDSIANIIPACLPCNRRKHAKTGVEFVALLRGANAV